MSRKVSIPPFLIDIFLVLTVVLTRVMAASRYLHKWDSVQFALALSDYDISRHQPHPPGYPLYIALAWLVRRVVADDNLSLILVGMISAAALAVLLHHMGRQVISVRGGIIAGILAAINPLLWYFSDIALAYIVGVAISAGAVWAALSLRGPKKALAPFLAGLSSTAWLPAGILVFPVCLKLFLHSINESIGSDKSRTRPASVRAALHFLVLFVIPLAAAFVPVVADTGGLRNYFFVAASESGKHILQIRQWLEAPLVEFVKNTESLAEFFKKSLGMGRWLLLMLLIPMAGERGTTGKGAAVLMLLAAAGFAALHWGADPALRSMGIFIAAATFARLLPVPIDSKLRDRRDLFVWWLAPGLLLFVPVYANYVGVLLVFVPPLILLEALAIDRAATFMCLQTARDAQPEDRKRGERARPPKEADVRVDRLVAWLLTFLMAVHEIGVFTSASGASQETWNGIITNDTFVESVISAVKESPVPESQLLILGGESDYRHWTYYLPEARIIWTKYLLYRDLHPGTTIWESRQRRQNKILPDYSGGDGEPLAATIPLSGEKAVLARPDEFERFAGTGTVVPLPVPAQRGETAAFLIMTEGRSKLVFSNNQWWLE